MVKEFEIITDILDSSGKVLKKNVLMKKTLETSDMQVDQFITREGKVVKKYCWIYTNGASYKCNQPYEIVKTYVLPIVVKGLAAKSRRK